MQGNVYQLMGPLVPSSGRAPVFSAVYIHETEYDVQSQRRMGNVPGLEEELLTSLAEVLHDVYPYVQTFQSLREWATNYNTPPIPYEMIIHADRRPAREKLWQCNGPEAAKVAAIIPGRDEASFTKRDIRVRRRGTLNIK